MRNTEEVCSSAMQQHSCMQYDNLCLIAMPRICTLSAEMAQRSCVAAQSEHSLGSEVSTESPRRQLPSILN